MKISITPGVLLCLLLTMAHAAESVSQSQNAPETERWALGAENYTTWQVSGSSLPHADFIEQGGRRVGQIVKYSISTEGALSVTRDVVWPSLRTIPNNTQGSLKRHYEQEANPVITVNGQPMGPITVSEVRLDGTLTFTGQAGVFAVRRVTFPSFEKYAAVDRWTLKNTGKEEQVVAIAPLVLSANKVGPYGKNIMSVTSDAPASTRLAAGQSMEFSILFSARLMETDPVAVNSAVEETSRREFIAGLNQTLRLETPDAVLNRAFTFAKWRVAEAINDTRGGMMLAPGKLAFYAATWCNDNVEYAGPFFPFLGDEGGNVASLNTYRQYIHFMKPDYGRIPCSIIAEGTSTWGPFDRGDAAMYAYGASRFCLARGDNAIAEELWKGIEWTLEYCKRKLTPDGVVASDTDELEGRFPTGKANLTTSSLYYGGLRSAANLGRALGKADLATEYDQRADAMAKAIDAYFGANVDGYKTYRYYDPATLTPTKKNPNPDLAAPPVLRAWICMPLSMGIFDRKQGTIDALFSSRLWTPDGLATQVDDKTFWDRSTLYGLRAAFQAGETTRALDYLNRYTRRRLLGEHVPYAVEAYPEGGKAHLSSESGLYCRVFTEGLFGILPTGLDRFRCTPRLPDSWPVMALRNIKAFGGDFDLEVARAGKKIQLRCLQGNKVIALYILVPGESAEVILKQVMPSPVQK